MDFSDVGNPLDSVLGILYDDEGDSGYEPAVESLETPAVSSEEVVKPPKKVHDPKLSKLMEELKGVCDAYGVLLTSHMANQVKTLSEKEEIFESHLVWYVRGIIMCNQTSVLPAISDSIGDMNTEVKHIQNVISSVKKVAADVEKNAGLFKRKIAESTDNIKASFEGVLTQLSKSFLRETAEKQKNDSPEHLKNEAEQAVKIGDKVEIKALSNEDDVKAVPPPVITGKSPVYPVSGIVGEWTAMKTDADPAKVLALKKNVMRSVGFSEKLIRAIPDDCYDYVLPNDLLLEVSKTKITTKVAKIIKTLITNNMEAKDDAK